MIVQHIFLAPQDGGATTYFCTGGSWSVMYTDGTLGPQGSSGGPGPLQPFLTLQSGQTAMLQSVGEVDLRLSHGTSNDELKLSPGGILASPTVGIGAPFTPTQASIDRWNLLQQTLRGAPDMVDGFNGMSPIGKAAWLQNAGIFLTGGFAQQLEEKVGVDGQRYFTFEPMPPPPPPQTHVDLYWWGYRIFLDQDDVEKVTGDASEAIEELIETIVGEIPVVGEILEPFLKVYFAGETAGIRLADRDGQGVNLSASWIAPLVIIPTAPR